MKIAIEKYIGEKNIASSQTKPFILIIGLVLLLTSGFRYVNWNPTYGGWIEKIVFLFLAFYFFTNKTNSKQYNFHQEIILLTFIPFISIFNSWSVYSQSIYDGLTATLSSLVWIVYFLLPRYKLSETTILKIFLFVAIFIVAVQVLQQFTYPNVLFGVSRAEDLDAAHTELAEQRNGLWRFRMHQNAYYTAPILFAAWTWLQKKANYKLLLLTVILLVSVYLTLTRQVMVACIFAIFLSFFLGKKRINKGAFFLGVALIISLYFVYDVLFSALAEQTKADSTEDNVRILSASYFWNESIKNPFIFLFGHGEFSSNSYYGQMLTQLQTVFGFYTVDVGFIGQIYVNGIIYVLVCYVLMYRVFFKLKNIVPTYIRMFVAFVGVMSPMIFPMTSASTYLVWVLLLYVCDLYINKSKNQIIINNINR